VNRQQMLEYVELPENERLPLYLPKVPSFWIESYKKLHNPNDTWVYISEIDIIKQVTGEATGVFVLGSSLQWFTTDQPRSKEAYEVIR